MIGDLADRRVPLGNPPGPPRLHLVDGLLVPGGRYLIARVLDVPDPAEVVYFGGGAEDPQRFRNRRAELFWELREALERQQAALPDDNDVRADLSALRYHFTQDGRIQIECKEVCRRRLGRSPDRADALALSWAAAQAPAPVEFAWV